MSEFLLVESSKVYGLVHRFLPHWVMGHGWIFSFPAPGLQENAQELTQRLERVASEATSGALVGPMSSDFLVWTKKPTNLTWKVSIFLSGDFWPVLLYQGNIKEDEGWISTTENPQSSEVCAKNCWKKMSRFASHFGQDFRLASDPTLLNLQLGAWSCGKNPLLSESPSFWHWSSRGPASRLGFKF